MSHQVIIHAPNNVSLPARPFTSIGLQSGTRHRAFLTRRPNAVRMDVSNICRARRAMESAFAAGITPSRMVADCQAEIHAEQRRSRWASLFTVLVLVAMVVACAACTGLLRL